MLRAHPRLRKRDPERETASETERAVHDEDLLRGVHAYIRQPVKAGVPTTGCATGAGACSSREQTGTLAVRRARVAAGCEVFEGETKSGRARLVRIPEGTIAALRRHRERSSRNDWPGAPRGPTVAT